MCHYDFNENVHNENPLHEQPSLNSLEKLNCLLENINFEGMDFHDTIELFLSLWSNTQAENLLILFAMIFARME